MPKLNLLLLATLAACSTMPPAAAAPATSMTGPAPAPSMAAPTGVYAATIAASDIPASAPAELQSGMVGAWQLVFDAPGHALVRYNGEQVVDAPFTVQGNHITFGDDSGSYACHDTAHYTWQMTGAGLVFTKLDDSCEGRALALTLHPWTKQP